MPANLPRAHSQHNTMQTNKQSDVRRVLFLVLATTRLANYLHLLSSTWNSRKDLKCFGLRLLDLQPIERLPEQERLSERKRLLRVCF